MTIKNDCEKGEKCIEIRETRLESYMIGMNMRDSVSYSNEDADDSAIFKGIFGKPNQDFMRTK